jgi:hypothetical protein
MRRTFLALVTIGLLGAQGSTPRPAVDPFTAVRFLEGEWKGEGDGKPGASSGGATFRFELEGRVLVRHSQADYPAANGRPASHHEDLLTCFSEGGSLKALYLDNEDHIIRYLVSTVPEGVAFTSEPSPGPRFRLTYLRKPEGLVTVRFEIAPPNKPEAFTTYLEGVTRKVK